MRYIVIVGSCAPQHDHSRHREPTSTLNRPASPQRNRPRHPRRTSPRLVYSVPSAALLAAALAAPVLRAEVAGIQARAVAGRKYFRRFCTFPAIGVLKLLDAAIFQVLLGNANAHARNYSLLWRRTGELALAPLYQPVDKTPVAFERRCIRVGPLRPPGHTVVSALRIVAFSLHLRSSKLHSSLPFGRIALLFASQGASPTRRLAALGAHAKFAMKIAERETLEESVR